MALVEQYHFRLVRLAQVYVARAEIAEEVAQETWLALLRGIDRFEERSALQTWLFQICVNRARTVGVREHRLIPDDLVPASVEAEQFTPSGAWVWPPPTWSASLEPDRDAWLVAAVRDAIGQLPANLQVVVTMRDVDGLTSDEVCHVLSISAANQRVLLHRGRAAVRARLSTLVRRP